MIKQSIQSSALVRGFFGLVLACGCAAPAQPSAHETSELSDAESARTDSVTLFTAAAKAYGEGRIEDASFFFHSAQMRARADLETFEPIGRGGDSPATLIGALRFQIGQALNPRMMRDRSALAGASERLAKLDLELPAEYSPGWDYKKPAKRADFRATAARLKSVMLPRIQENVALLSDDDYFESFCKVQDYNFNGVENLALARGEKPQLVSETEYRAAMERLAEIERQREVRFGIFTQGTEPSPRPPSPYKVDGDSVLYHNKPIAGADASTFDSMDDGEFAKDAHHVYVSGVHIDGADPATFQILEGAYARDETRFYCGSVRMEVRKPDEFEVVEVGSIWSTCLSKSSFLFDYGDPFAELVISPDSPVVVGQGWARDGEVYYYGPAIVEAADNATFEIISSFEAKDAEREYHGFFPADELQERREKYLWDDAE